MRHRDPTMDPKAGDEIVTHGTRLKVLGRAGVKITYRNARGEVVERPLTLWRTAALGGEPARQEAR